MPARSSSPWLPGAALAAACAGLLALAGPAAGTRIGAGDPARGADRSLSGDEPGDEPLDVSLLSRIELSILVSASSEAWQPTERAYLRILALDADSPFETVLEQFVPEADEDGDAVGVRRPAPWGRATG